MKQEDKQLLLVVLWSWVPYGVKIKSKGDNELYTLLAMRPNKDIAVIGFQIDDIFVTSKIKIDAIKPYLRPMSSMSEEEKKEFIDAVTWEANGKFYIDECEDISFYQEKYDWLNAHHFDYRGLIPKGLAVSTDEFNPYK